MESFSEDQSDEKLQQLIEYFRFHVQEMRQVVLYFLLFRSTS
jgi:hypothetical protein